MSNKVKFKILRAFLALEWADNGRNAQFPGSWNYSQKIGSYDITLQVFKVGEQIRGITGIFKHQEPTIMEIRTSDILHVDRLLQQLKETGDINDPS